MEVRNYESLSEYLSQRLWDDRNMIFRGVSDSSYQLIPSIGLRKAKSLEWLYSFEKQIFEDFKQKAFRFMSHEPRNDYEWLFLAQHYGIPTRLLDWTENPLVALYFACEKNPEKECAVYKITMLRWYFDLDEHNPFEAEEIVGLRPPHKDVRYINQAGVFTIHPKPTELMNYPNTLKCVFGPTVKELIRWQLRKLGIHATLIYPSLESLAHDIIGEHESMLLGGTVKASGNMFEL